jgi:hypothetical protein
MSLRLHPVTLRTARAFVQAVHRHHGPPQGHRFSIGVVNGTDELVGVVIVGRPVARHLDDGVTVEVTRVATTGERNACSLLYGAARRAARAMGFHKAITYTQDGETGASLRAAGWTLVAELPPVPGWDRPGRARRSLGTDHVGRSRWEVQLQGR